MSQDKDAVRREDVPQDDLVGPKSGYADEKKNRKNITRSGDYRGQFEQGAMERGEAK